VSASVEVELLVDPDGLVRGIYSDEVDWLALGEALGSGPLVCRASAVEPDGAGGWTADLAASGGPVLGPFPKRAEALAAEGAWLREHNLGRRAEA
jgi:hypothetical protein